MSREEQIEEMTVAIDGMNERNAHYYDEYMEECEAFADGDAIAKVLYDKGFRKQNEVVKEIFEEIENNLFSCGVNFVISKEAFVELKKKYIGGKENDKTC